MDKDLDVLGRINKVEVPPFLYTRILARIENEVEIKVSLKWVLSGTMSIALLFILNFWVIQNISIEEQNNLTEVFSLYSSNMLYNEEN